MVVELARGVPAQENELTRLGGGGAVRVSAIDAHIVIMGGVILEVEEAKSTERLSMPMPMALLRVSMNQVSDLEGSDR